MKTKNRDYIKLIWTGIGIVVLVVGMVFFMKTNDAESRVDDSYYIEDVQPVSPPSGGEQVSIVGDKELVEKRRMDIEDIKKDVDLVAELQTQRMLFDAVPTSAYETPEEYTAALFKIGDALREHSDITWFIDSWFICNPEYFEDVHWVGYVDHFDVLSQYIPVMWICENTDGHFLMCVKAFYDVNSGKYVEASRAYTTLSNIYFAYTDNRKPDEIVTKENVLSSVFDILRSENLLPPGVTKDQFLSNRDGEGE